MTFACFSKTISLIFIINILFELVKMTASQRNSETKNFTLPSGNSNRIKDLLNSLNENIDLFVNIHPTSSNKQCYSLKQSVSVTYKYKDNSTTEFEVVFRFAKREKESSEIWSGHLVCQNFNNNVSSLIVVPWNTINPARGNGNNRKENVTSTATTTLHPSDVEALSRTQVVVITTCSIVIGVFFFVAGILRIKSYVKRQWHIYIAAGKTRKKTNFHRRRKKHQNLDDLCHTPTPIHFQVGGGGFPMDTQTPLYFQCNTPAAQEVVRETTNRSPTFSGKMSGTSTALPLLTEETSPPKTSRVKISPVRSSHNPSISSNYLSVEPLFRNSSKRRRSLSEEIEAIMSKHKTGGGSSFAPRSSSSNNLQSGRRSLNPFSTSSSQQDWSPGRYFQRFTSGLPSNNSPPSYGSASVAINSSTTGLAGSIHKRSSPNRSQYLITTQTSSSLSPAHGSHKLCSNSNSRLHLQRNSIAGPTIGLSNTLNPAAACIMITAPSPSLTSRSNVTGINGSSRSGLALSTSILNFTSQDISTSPISLSPSTRSINGGSNLRIDPTKRRRSYHPVV